MEERKMEKNMRKIFLGILIIGLTVFLSGIAIAGAEVSISGVINDQIMEMVGSKVTVKGTVMEAEGTKIITISSFKIIE
jgi:hypothetical protein